MTKPNFKWQCPRASSSWPNIQMTQEMTLNCEVTTRKIGVLSCACVSLGVCTLLNVCHSLCMCLCVPVYVCHFVYVGTYVCVLLWACTRPCVCSPHIMFMFSHRKAELYQPLSFARQLNRLIDDHFQFFFLTG